MTEPEFPPAADARVDLREALEFAAKRRSGAVVIVHHGRIVAEHYLLGWDAHVPVPLTSVSKSLVAVQVGMLLKQGVLRDIDQSIADFLTEWRNDARAAITLRMLLNMTSGLRNPPLWRLALKSRKGLGLELDAAHPPGEVWEYNTAAYRLLFLICERASGLGMRALFQRNLFEPLDMRETRWLLRNSDEAAPEEVVNIAASPTDLARFGQLVAQRGEWQGQALLDGAFIDAALTATQSHNLSYGYLFWLNCGPRMLFPDAPPDTVAAMGARYCRLFVIPSRGLVIVRTGERAALAGEAIGKRSGNQNTFDNLLLRYILAAFAGHGGVATDDGGTSAAPTQSDTENL